MGLKTQFYEFRYIKFLCNLRQNFRFSNFAENFAGYQARYLFFIVNSKYSYNSLMGLKKKFNELRHEKNYIVIYEP